MWKVKERKKGFLVLTNQRLLFLEEQSTAGKTYCQTVTVPLTDISQIWMEKEPAKSAPEMGEGKARIFHLAKMGDRKNLEKIKKLIEDYYLTRKKEDIQSAKL